MKGFLVIMGGACIAGLVLAGALGAAGSMAIVWTILNNTDPM